MWQQNHPGKEHSSLCPCFTVWTSATSDQHVVVGLILPRCDHCFHPCRGRVECEEDFSISSSLACLADLYIGLLYIKQPSVLPSQCQSTPTTESVRPGPQRASESNQCFDFPSVAECNHRLQHHNMVTPPSTVDGPVTAKYHIFYVFPLVSFWFAGLVRLGLLIPHHVSEVGLVLTDPCYAVDNVGMRNNKHTNTGLKYKLLCFQRVRPQVSYENGWFYTATPLICTIALIAKSLWKK